jgi:uncharacterized repeat protein (TIGR03843 family)
MPTVAHQFGIGIVGVELVDVVRAGREPEGWLRVLEASDAGGADVVVVHADDPALRALALLDVVANNADRKGGHVLSASTGIRGCDHGLTFNVEDKLRTVLWGFAGRRLSSVEDAELGELAGRLATPADPLTRLLGDLLTADEVLMTDLRVTELRRTRRLPSRGGRWPAVPWPVF